MALRINLNVSAMNAHRQLSQTDNALGGSIEKLSSGYRINRAADDPAGLAISENLRAQISGIGQAVSNSNDAVNMIKTAEGALAEVHSQLRAMRDLAVHASNDGGNDQTSLDADQNQIKEALNALTRISSNTQFGEKKLLDGTWRGTSAGGSDLVFQVGSAQGQTLTMSIASTAPSALGLSGLSVNTGQTDAADAIALLDTAIKTISTQRASLGSIQKSLQSNINSLGVAKENISASESSIRDTDMAAEMVNFTRNQIMEQAGVSMLAQANSAPQQLLSLLR